MLGALVLKKSVGLLLTISERIQNSKTYFLFVELVPSW